MAYTEQFFFTQMDSQYLAFLLNCIWTAFFICTNIFTSFFLMKVCCCSVAQSCLSLCDSMECSTPGFPVRHQHPELAQTHVHLVCDAIQASHPWQSPSPPTFNFSQHQDLFQ